MRDALSAPVAAAALLGIGLAARLMAAGAAALLAPAAEGLAPPHS